MEKLESVGTTPSHVAVSDRTDAHRSSSDNPKSGRRARHGVSTTGCPSIVDRFPDPLDLGSNPIRPVPGAIWFNQIPGALALSASGGGAILVVKDFFEQARGACTCARAHRCAHRCPHHPP